MIITTIILKEKKKQAAARQPLKTEYSIHGMYYKKVVAGLVVSLVEPSR